MMLAHLLRYSFGAALASKGLYAEAIDKFKHILAHIDPADMRTYQSMYRASMLLQKQRAREDSRDATGATSPTRSDDTTEDFV